MVLYALNEHLQHMTVVHERCYLLEMLLGNYTFDSIDGATK